MPNRRRVSASSPFLSKYRNRVERFFDQIRHFRGAATRYDEVSDNSPANVEPAARIWLHILWS